MRNARKRRARRLRIKIAKTSGRSVPLTKKRKWQTIKADRPL